MTTSSDIEARYKECQKNAPGYIEIPDMNRVDLADMFADCRLNRGAEIGTERGYYAMVLCEANPDLELFCIDPWTAYSAYREHVSQAKLDKIYLEAVENLAPYRINFVKRFSTEAAESFPDGFFDFVYIDGNHEYSFVMADIVAWLPKVRKGGIISGHDYIRRKNPEYKMDVVDVLEDYRVANNIDPIFLVGTKEFRPEWKRDRPRSWFWVVE